MSSYTHKNLESIKNSAAEFGMEEGIETRFGFSDLNCTDTGFSHHRMAAGLTAPFAHVHDDAEEVYVVIGGSGTITLDDETLSIGRLDAVRVAPEVSRTLAAGDDGIEVLVFGPRRENDGRLVHPE